MHEGGVSSTLIAPHPKSKSLGFFPDGLDSHIAIETFIKRIK